MLEESCVPREYATAFCLIFVIPLLMALWKYMKQTHVFYANMIKYMHVASNMALSQNVERLKTALQNDQTGTIL